MEDTQLTYYGGYYEPLKQLEQEVLGWLNERVDELDGRHQERPVEHIRSRIKTADEVQENNERQEIDMKELVEKAVEPFHEVLEQKDVMLSVEAEDGLIVRANREQIEQLVTILMDNASKYVSEHGSIVWKLGKNHKGVTFSVANTTEEDKIDTARLFDRFYRNDSSRSSKTGGHGIGLSIAKKIVDAHKGSIAAESEGNTVIFSGMIP